MELLLIRHGLPERIEVDDGVADPPLSAVGIGQADDLGRYLAAEQIDVVWSSPLRRAAQTAEIVGRLIARPVQFHDGLAESDRGSASYIPMEELKADNDARWVAVVERMRSRAACDEHELAFREVVVQAMEEIIATHPGQRVAVVCHAGVINAYFGAIADIKRALWFDPGYTSINRVLASRRGDRGIGSLNEVAHLRRPLTDRG